MDYIIRKNSIVYVDEILIDKTLRKYLIDLSKSYFKNIKSIRDTVKTKLKIYRNIPLYISKDIFLVPITSLNINYYINYSRLKETYTKDGISTFIFNDGRVINLTISKQIMDRINRNVEKVYDYISLIEYF